MKVALQVSGFNPDHDESVRVYAYTEGDVILGYIDFKFELASHVRNQIVPVFADASHYIQAKLIMRASEMIDSFFDEVAAPSVEETIEV